MTFVPSTMREGGGNQCTLSKACIIFCTLNVFPAIYLHPLNLERPPPLFFLVSVYDATTSTPPLTLARREAHFILQKYEPGHTPHLPNATFQKLFSFLCILDSQVFPVLCQLKGTETDTENRLKVDADEGNGCIYTTTPFSIGYNLHKPK